jgi:hypothetical protein
MKLFLLVLFFILLLDSGMAQTSEPKIEVFGGYSYINVRPNFDQDRVSLNGWDSNIKLILRSYLSMEADLSGHYGSINGSNVNMHTLLIGPRFGRHGKRFNWFGHSLYGIAHISGDGDVLTPLIGRPSDTGFAFIPGGGAFEININKKLTYRVFQFDLLSTLLGNGVGQLHPRVSSGVVFSFGR